MNPVLVDWLTLLLAPVIIGSGLVSCRGTRRALTSGQPRPASSNVAQVIMLVAVLLMAVIHIA